MASSGRISSAGRRDWSGFAAEYPEKIASLTLLNAFDPRTVQPFATRLLAITGDRGAAAAAVGSAAEHLPGIEHVRLHDYNLLGWSDVAAERREEVAGAILRFLARMNSAAPLPPAALPEGEGEAAGITYRIRGAGPPLVLLPAFLTPSQWEPVLPLLAERFCTITLGGPALEAVAVLEARGQAIGYLQMVRMLVEEARLQAGEAVLEVGCGTGVLCRWLASRTAGKNRVTGADINPYLLREAAALARRDGLDSAIAFREGNAESLPFADNSLDVAMSVTVIEEADADRMIGEMVRVAKPGGRVAIIARAVDMPFLINLPLSVGLRAKVEAPGAVGQVAAQGCADASLYRRMHKAGLAHVKMLPQLAALTAMDAVTLQFIGGQLLPKMSREEAAEWEAARAQAETDGTFFIAWPHHCAVGTVRS